MHSPIENRPRANEPIAIIGIGCRFPGGANDPAAFWKLLEQGVDAITEVPPERWNVRAFYDPVAGKPGKSVARWGGFIEGIDRFDPQFFGISPREASRMDPQQRLLLEVAYEALEDGGQVVERLAGSRTAVFVGISSWDYTVLQTSFRDRGNLDLHSNTGGSLSIAANRLSYCFDFRGPSSAVDTACSSALLAVHLACQSIWREQCPLALAGGVNALLAPDSYITFSRMGMLSPDGRCKAFDATANGFVRSEGAGMVILKPLAQAQADGDPIYAVIRATAVNQDGRTPGLTVPSQEAQEALLRQACDTAGVAPSQIQYMEAHGTGTLVGDPIEARALGRVIAAERPAGQPCLVGSVKTNIGHLEAASGIAGLIKTALAVYHRRIPGNLHFNEPNPAIDFEQLHLRVPRRSEPWPDGDGPALAGVNSFGFGGTNAFVLVQEAADRRLQPVPSTQYSVLSIRGTALPAPDSCSLTAVLVPLSARSPEALRAMGGNIRQFLASCPGDVTLNDIAAHAALRRSHHEHRLAAVATSKAELDENLASFLAGQPVPGISSGRAAGQRPRLAYVCSGQGPQWWAMGRQLLAQEPIFREVIEQCDALVRQLGPWSLLEELTADEAHSRMAETAISQPALFALEVALAALWHSWGVTPEAVIGHSVGEVAAAYLAGVFTLEDAMRVIYQRGGCMDRASSRGRMLAVGLELEEARKLTADYGGHVSVAAMNSPTSVTLSGEAGPLEEIAQALEQRQVFCRFLQVHYAFHSAQMEPVRDELLASLKGIRPQPATLPFFSTVTGEKVAGPELGPEYWWHNVRQTVRFAEGVARLIEMGCDAVVELSPHPVLTAAVAECYQHHGKPVQGLPSLRRSEDERATMLRSLGRLYTLGYRIDWTGVGRLAKPSHGQASPGRFVRLPLYPWQRERYWFESDESRLTRLTAPAHPLLGTSLGEPQPTFSARLDLRLLPSLADHRVQRAAILPSTAYVEIALAMAREVFGLSACQVDDVKLANPCFLTPEQALHFETVFHAADGTVQGHARPVDREADWTPHFSAVVRSHAPAEPSRLDPELIKQRCSRAFGGVECYAVFARIGFDYGPLYQGIAQAWQGDRESLGVIQVPDGLASEVDDYLVHPAVLDACFQVVLVADKEFPNGTVGLYIPTEIEQVRLYRRPQGRLFSHARLVEKTSRWAEAAIDIYAEDGQPVAQVRGLRCQCVLGDGGEQTLDDLLYAYQWHRAEDQETRRQEDTEAGSWLIFADHGGVGERLVEQLRARGGQCTVLFASSAVKRNGSPRPEIDPGSREAMQRFLQGVVGPGRPACRGIIHLWNLDAPSADGLSTAALDAAQDAGLLSVLHLVQAWDKLGVKQPAPPLVLVTRGAQPAPQRPVRIAVAQGAVIGLGRGIISEYPGLRCKLADLDPEADPDAAARRLCEELWQLDDEDEVALRGSDRYVHRYLPLSSAADSAQPATCNPQPAIPSYRLTTRHPGTLDALTLRALRRRPPGQGEVEIAVRAAGLNFSDVMKALGIYPGLPDGPVPLGIECSGTISAVGEGVAGLRVGDEVLAIAAFAFSSHVTTRAELVALKPAHISFEEAATIPLAFLTAAYALDRLGQLSAGERVLIHSATGGVGLAAIQLAQRVGAGIFATAGTAEKRQFLKDLGIAHVMDSRSLAFADQVLEETGGRGVDVVLNSLAGEAIARGIATLADSGRFLEIGKRDIYQNTRLGLRPFRKNLSFFAIDLDRLLRQRPAVLGALLQELVREVRDGRLKPLPHRVFPIADAIGAFRHMQQGKHIGKVVLSFQESPATVAGADDEPLTFRADGCYLLTGGLGGFGLATARWLVERGARHLVLVGRRGAHSAEAQQAVADLEKLGAQVVVRQADVARAEDVRAVLAEIERSLPPLRGVFHAAMVLEDSLLLNLDDDLMRRVLAPKMQGAWNLHTQTLSCPLDCFVLFSSLASIFGHAGQANYSAANAFLDSLAHYRRALGLPALTVNWGYLGDAGYLAQRRQLGERLERQGIKAVNAREALALLERSLQQQRVQVSIMRVDWSRCRGLGVTGRLSPRFAHLCLRTGTAAGPTRAAAASTLADVRSAAPDQRRTLLDAVLRDKVARVLGTSAAKLDADKPLLYLGIDSLMAVELRNWVERELQVNLPIVELMRSPSLSSLTEVLLEQLVTAESPLETPPQEPTNGVAAVDGATPEELLANLHDLSGEQVDALLSSLLADKDRL